jgi:putative phosphoesterase
MKFLIFSDLHGNHHVLSSLKNAINYYRPNFILYLGDVFGYYYGFKDCIEFLKEINSICIMGNHDKYAQQILNGDKKLLNQVIEKYGSGYERLIEDHQYYLDYLNQLKTNHSVIANKARLFFVHGSIRDNLEGRIYPDTKLSIDDFDGYDIIFSGHTHHKCIKYVKGKLWVNVGSSGQPRDGQPPNFVVFDDETGTIIFNNIEFDKDLIRNDLIQNGDFKFGYSDILNRKPKYESDTIQ